MIAMNNCIFVILAVAGMLTAATLFYSANADISIKEPPNWQASPRNNFTNMAWFQNSTQSILLITKTPSGSFPLSLIASIFAQAMAEMDLLESSDQISFGQSNFGYRYILNISSIVQNVSSFMQNLTSTTIQTPFHLPKSMKAMVILSQKHGENYGVVLMTPTNNFDAVINEIKPTLDSIKITKSPLDKKTKWTEYNSTLGISLEHPANWTVKQDRDVVPSDSLYDSICNSATGTCFNIITGDLKSGFNDTHLDLLSRSWLNSTVNASRGDKLLSPLQMANYTIDGEKANVFSEVLIIPNSDVVAEKQVITVMHNGTFYVFEFGGHYNTLSKSGEKEIGQHIIESINWTEPSPDLKWTKYNNSTLGVSLEYPSSWYLNSTTNQSAVCDPETGTCFLIELTNGSVNADLKTSLPVYQEIEAQNSSDMIERTKMSNYTIGGEPSAEGTRRLIQPETGEIVHQKEILTMHDSKIYLLFFGGNTTEMTKPETTEIFDHIIKSINWTSP